MPKRSISVISAFLFCWSAAAQQQQPTITIQKSAELVTIPVLVTDKSGKPVHGLNKQDFTVKEDGKTDRPIAVFEELQATPGPVKKASRAETVFSNFDVSDTKLHRVTIIVLDMLNTPFTAQAHTRAELIKFLASNVRGNDPIALLVIGRNGLSQIHAITSNPEILIQALKRVRGQYSNADSIAADETAQANVDGVTSATRIDQQDVSDETGQLNSFLKDSESMATAFQQREAIRITLAALEQIAHAFGGLPGRKTLIWASSGFPFMVEDPKSILGFGTDTVADYERTFRTMNTANIAVYPIDAVGLFNPSYRDFDPSRRGNPRPRESMRPVYDRYQQTQDTLRTFASATGGNVCLNTNDLAKCFHEAEQDSDAYYMIAYYLPPDDRKPGWHKLKVTVDRKDTHVRARSGFLVASPQVIKQEDTRKTEILTALGSPVDYTSLPFVVGWGEVKPDEATPGRVLAQFQLGLYADAFTVDSDQNNHLELDIAALALTDSKKEAGEYTKTIEAHLKPESLDTIRRAGIRFNGHISLPKGKFTVRFVVRDDLGGRIGTVTAPVEIN
ncbi:MAG: VWA domain-containing protein [Acidobacteriaceae bacterium]